MIEYHLDTQILESLASQRGHRSLSALLEAAGLHRNTLRDYKNRKRSAFSSTVDRIAKFLDVDPIKLTTRTPTTSGRRAPESEVISILRSASRDHPEIAFALFGSRAKNKAREYSDFDIAITGGATPIETRTYLAIKDQIESLSDDLPYAVDIVNFDAAPDWFLENMDVRPKFLAGNKESFYFLLGKLSVYETRIEN